MEQPIKNQSGFVGYDYREITVGRAQQSLYADSYACFNWALDSLAKSGPNEVTLRFKRDRKFPNKAELTRLGQKFDALAGELRSLERAKTIGAARLALAIGFVATALMAGATFAYLGGLLALCALLAVPGLAGWALARPVYNRRKNRRAAALEPQINETYDAIYETCQKASQLLAA